LSADCNLLLISFYQINENRLCAGFEGQPLLGLGFRVFIQSICRLFYTRVHNNTLLIHYEENEILKSKNKKEEINPI